MIRFLNTNGSLCALRIAEISPFPYTYQFQDGFQQEINVKLMFLKIFKLQNLALSRLTKFDTIILLGNGGWCLEKYRGF